MSSDDQKVRIVSDFLLHAPPGELNEVFNDIRYLIANDAMLTERIKPIVAKYNREHFTPVKLDGCDEPALITEFCDLGDDRFYDPRSRRAFRFDHFRLAASDVQAFVMDADAGLEAYRAALESALTTYVHSYYKQGGASCAVYVQRDEIVCAIECHSYQPKNYWNGRWRSLYTIRMANGSAELTGQCIVHVHYYEDGNVQLLVNKDVHGMVNKAGEPDMLARGAVALIEKEEGLFHGAVNENYASMSDSTFKALRRQLPITKSKIDWDKIAAFKVGAELRGAAS